MNGDRRCSAIVRAGQVFAGRIEVEHRAATGAARTAIEHAVECGRLLIEAKTQVGHGGWLTWVDEHLTFGARQAAKYMRLHRHRKELNRNRSSDFGVNAALAELAAPQHAKADDEAKELVRLWEDASPAAREWFFLALDLVGRHGHMPEFLAYVDRPTLRRMVDKKPMRECGA